MGYLVEAPCAYPELTVRENLEIVRRWRGIADRACVDRILRRLRLEAHASKKARHLSLGNMQRLGIAKALIHQPKLLILDEPANGLDPEGAVEFRELLHDLAANQGVTILLSSHRLGEIAKIASCIAVMHKGRLVRFLDRLGLERERKKTLLLSGRDMAAMADALSKAGFEAGVKKNGDAAGPPVLCIEDRDAVEHPERIVTLLVRAGCLPNLLKVEEDLEAFFMRVIREAGGKNREAVRRFFAGGDHQVSALQNPAHHRTGRLDDSLCRRIFHVCVEKPRLRKKNGVHRREGATCGNRGLAFLFRPAVAGRGHWADQG